VKTEIRDIRKQLWKDNDTTKEELSRVGTSVLSINRKVDLSRDDNKK